MVALKHLPISSRPRERISAGESLGLEELVAVLIGSGNRSQSAFHLAEHAVQALLNKDCSFNDLLAIPGLGQAKAALLLAATQLHQSLEARRLEVLPKTPEDVYRYCQDLCGKPQEHLVAFFVDVRSKQLERSIISIGTASASLVHPREVFRPAILANAHAIILAHNHPSGDPTPSAADKEVTRQIAQAGRVLNIQLLDHVVCGRQGYVSMREFAPDSLIAL